MKKPGEGIKTLYPCFDVWLQTNRFLFSGWAHNFLPESQPFGLLLIPSGHWSLNLYVERQRDSKSGCGVCDFGLEFMGCVSFHEFSGQPETKSPCTLPGFPHVCVCWFSHNCHWLVKSGLEPIGIYSNESKLNLLHRNFMCWVMFFSFFFFFDLCFLLLWNVREHNLRIEKYTSCMKLLRIFQSYTLHFFST